MQIETVPVPEAWNYVCWEYRCIPARGSLSDVLVVRSRIDICYVAIDCAGEPYSEQYVSPAHFFSHFNLV